MHHTTIPGPHSSENVQGIARTRTLRILPDIVLDRGLSPLALRAFLVLLNCRDRTTGQSSITSETIAKRLGRTKTNALKAIKQLIDHGYIRNLAGERRAGVYEFLAGVEINTRERKVVALDSLKPERLSDEELARSRAAGAPVLEAMRTRYARPA